MNRVSPKKSLKKTFWTLLMGFSIIILFQNCGDLSDGDVITVTDIESQLIENLPFAYESQIDQIAYMSCSGQYARGNPDAFTLKAGAYGSNSGIKLRDSFVSQISGLPAKTQEIALELSQRNYQGKAVLSIRQRNNLQTYLDPNSKQGEKPVSKLMFEEVNGRLFSSRHYARHLLTLGPGNYMNYVPGLSGFTGKTFDGVVKIADNGGAEDLVRNYLRDTHYLTVTYPVPIGEDIGAPPYSIVRSPWDTLSGDDRAKTNVFGKGYALNFQQFDGAMPDVPSRVLNVDYAVNLENQQTLNETWDCSERFVIVRPQDVDRKTYDTTPDAEVNDSHLICDTNPDAEPTTIQEEKRWERIRNVLPAEDWYVSLPGPSIGDPGTIKPGCIVPKKSDFCYDMEELTGGNEDSPNIRIAYYRDEDRNGGGWGYTVGGMPDYTGRCGPGTHFVCPHFVSICHKTN